MPDYIIRGGTAGRERLRLLSRVMRPATLGLLDRAGIRPGGSIAVADTDFRGHFCYPDNAAFQRYVDLYSETLARRGGNANVGPRLPRLLIDAGFERVDAHVAQPAGLEGDVKLVAPLTMENIAEAVVAEGVATREEVDAVVAELYALAETPGALMSAARVVEAWGRRPAAV